MLPLAAIAIAVGHHHCCAALTSGGVACWGLNTDGQVGTGDYENKNTPTSVVGIGPGVCMLNSISTYILIA